MKKCPKCGRMNDIYSTYCSKCQNLLSTDYDTSSIPKETSVVSRPKICPNCGEPNDIYSTHCTKCKFLFTAAYDPDHMPQQGAVLPKQEDIIPVSNWIGTLIVLGIPFVNFIALIIMAISSPYKSKRNYALAGLILMSIGFALLILFTFWAALSESY